MFLFNLLFYELSANTTNEENGITIHHGLDSYNTWNDKPNNISRMINSSDENISNTTSKTAMNQTGNSDAYNKDGTNKNRSIKKDTRLINKSSGVKNVKHDLIETTNFTKNSAIENKSQISLTGPINSTTIINTTKYQNPLEKASNSKNINATINTYQPESINNYGKLNNTNIRKHPKMKKEMYTCHRAAKKINGKCKCINGLVGDGIYKCFAPVPQLVDLSRKSAPFNKQFKFIATIKEPDFLPASVWCNVGGVKIKAEFLSSTEIKCPAPPLKTETEVSISFDLREWSNTIKIPNKGRISDAIITFRKTTIFGLIALIFVLSLYKLRQIYLKSYKNYLTELYEKFKRERAKNKRKHKKARREKKTKETKPPPIIVLKPNIITSVVAPPPPPPQPEAENLLLLDV